MKNDVYQIITDRIIQLLESGTVPWHKPWKGGGAPQNMVSKRAYRGINIFLLNGSKFASPYWLSFKQVQSLDGRVKKGEKSSPVVFWKVLEEEENGETKKIPFLRFHSVFNIEQCEGITVPAVGEPTQEFQPIQTCGEIVAHMPKPPKIEHAGGRAAYSPTRDTVSMPDSKLFESSEAYYNTLFHELTHATGHISRLNRKEITDPIHFGSNPYSREELVAEMGAAFLCGHSGIVNAILDNSASYIQSWLSRLKEDRKLVVLAAAQAQKACDYILDIPPELEGQIQNQPKESEAAVLRERVAPESIHLYDQSQREADYMSDHGMENPPFIPERISYGASPKKGPATSRTLKIEKIGEYWNNKVTPRIRLNGCWLERAGFIPGSHVSVNCVAPGVIELRLQR